MPPRCLPYWAANASFATFPGTGGIALAYARITPPKGKVAKATVVISNGRTESFVKYKELAFDLARAGYAVYVHDHRGQGLSPRLLAGPAEHDKGHVELFDDYVEDLQAFVQTVVRREQAGKLFLLAHRWAAASPCATCRNIRRPSPPRRWSSPMLAPNARIIVSPEGGCWWFMHTRWLCPTCYAGYLKHPLPADAADAARLHAFAGTLGCGAGGLSEAPQAQLGGPDAALGGRGLRGVGRDAGPGSRGAHAAAAAAGR